jgi:ABC-type antimicrobial peptide transport system permease subunit
MRSDLGDGTVNRAMREIVGVVGNIKRKGLTQDAAPEYYMPFSQALITNPYFTIRTRGNAAGIESAIRNAVSQLDSSIPVYSVSPLEHYVATSEAPQRFQAVLLACFAGIALLLSAIGLYGLLSYIVVQRTFEIGLRMAIGAQRSDMLQMILRRGLQLTAIGLGVGLVASALLTRFLTRMLYGVKPLDLITFTAVSVVLLAVSALASFAPAWRASHLDPMKTLRDQ